MITSNKEIRLNNILTDNSKRMEVGRYAEKSCTVFEHCLQSADAATQFQVLSFNRIPYLSYPSRFSTVLDSKVAEILHVLSENIEPIQQTLPDFLDSIRCNDIQLFEDLEQVEPYAKQFFACYLNTVQWLRELTLIELDVIYSFISHLRAAWHLEYTSPAVILGVQVIRCHFSRKFELHNYSAYRVLLEKVLNSGYFEKVDQDSIELRAFGQLVAYELSLRDENQSDRENHFPMELSLFLNSKT